MGGHDTQILLEDADPLGCDAAQLQREMRAEALRRYGDLLDGSAPPPPFEPPVPWSVFLIARVDGQVVGCGAVWPMEAGIAEVRRMFVAASFRRRGIARRLLVELERRAAGFGYRVLRLATGVRQPEAIALYESFGFRVVGRRRGYYYDTGEDALVMEVALSAERVPPGNQATR